MNAALKWLFPILSAVLYFNLSYYTDRSNFNILISQVSILYILFILIYWKLMKEADFLTLSQIQGWSVGLRLILLFSIPNLSDDYFRFLWDGLISLSGENPYAYVPSDYESTILIAPFHSLYEGMNSQNYYSVYPPINQFIFELTASMFPGSILKQVIYMKSMLFLGELYVIFALPRLLLKLNVPVYFSLFYLLNPLVILEISGNLHFEGLTITFLVAFLSFLLAQRTMLSSVFFGLAIGIKMIPLIFLPALARYFELKDSLKFVLISALVFTLPFVLFFDAQMISHIWQSIDLYFQTFEFNASVYYIIRYIGFKTVGYNIIQSAGIVLSVIVVILTLIFAFKIRTRDIQSLLHFSFYTLLVYYLLSTTIHPWYLMNLLFFSLFTIHYRSVFLWTFLSFLSYSAYSNPDYHENLWLVSIEYILFLSMFVYELMESRKSKHA